MNKTQSDYNIISQDEHIILSITEDAHQDNLEKILKDSIQKIAKYVNDKEISPKCIFMAFHDLDEHNYINEYSFTFECGFVVDNKVPSNGDIKCYNHHEKKAITISKTKEENSRGAVFADLAVRVKALGLEKTSSIYEYYFSDDLITYVMGVKA